MRDCLGCNPLSGHLFLFANSRRTRLKVLVWDGSGLWECAKQLQKGRFRWPELTGEEPVRMSPEELMLLLNGVDLYRIKRGSWYRKCASKWNKNSLDLLLVKRAGFC